MATPEPLLETIRELVVGAAPRKLNCPVDASSRLRADLGFDSIGLMTLAFQIENAFDIDLSSHADKYRHITTVGDVVEFVNAVLQDSAA